MLSCRPSATPQPDKDGENILHQQIQEMKNIWLSVLCADEMTKPTQRGGYEKSSGLGCVGGGRFGWK